MHGWLRREDALTNPVKRPEPSPLVGGGDGLEEELARISSVAREAQRLPLDSQRNVERTADKLAELGAVDEQLGPLVQQLLGAVGALVQRQQEQAWPSPLARRRSARGGRRCARSSTDTRRSAATLRS